VRDVDRYRGIDLYMTIHHLTYARLSEKTSGYSRPVDYRLCSGLGSRQHIAAPWSDVLAALYSSFEANSGVFAASPLASYLGDIARAVSSFSAFVG
jgi:hypothetical protein